MKKLVWMAMVTGWMYGCSDSGSNNDMNGNTGDMATGGLSCASYCALIGTACTGNQQQYIDNNTCLNDCMLFPVGSAADTSGNTLGCRTYHANAAKSDPVTHCQHAGPGGAGMCGSNCTGFCQQVQHWCVGPNQVYTSLADCMTQCATFPDDAPVGAVTQTGNHQACLVWHSMEAGGGTPADHCLGDIAPGDGGIKSMTCR